MRKLFFMLSISALLVFSLMTSLVYASDERPLGIAVFYGGTLNVRSGPGVSYGVITSVGNGTTFLVRSLENGWYSVLFVKEGKQIEGYVRDNLVDFTPHNFEFFAGEIIDCTVDSINVYRCSDCQFEFHETVPAREHDLVYVFGVTTSCEVETYDYKRCTVCGYEVLVGVNPPKGHDLNIWYSGVNGGSFSCETGGYRCGRCNRSLCRYEFYEFVPPGHVWSEVVRIEPTYHSTGTITNQCDFCGHREYITIPVLVDDGMSEDVYSLGSAFMSGVWKFFGVYVPGFGFTFGGLSLGIVIVSLSLSVIYMIFGFGRRGGAVSSRSGSTNKAKISKERENDDH